MTINLFVFIYIEDRFERKNICPAGKHGSTSRMLSGCIEEEIESNNAPVAGFRWSPGTISVNKTVEFTSTSMDADGDDLIIQHNL